MRDRVRKQREDRAAAYANAKKRKKDKGPPPVWPGAVLTGVGAALVVTGTALQTATIVERRRCVANFDCTNSFDFANTGAGNRVGAQVAWIAAMPFSAAGGALLGRTKSGTRAKRGALIGVGSVLLATGLSTLVVTWTRASNRVPGCPIGDYVDCTHRSIARTEGLRFFGVLSVQASMFMIPFGAELQRVDKRGKVRSRAHLHFGGGANQASLELTGAF